MKRLSGFFVMGTALLSIGTWATPVSAAPIVVFTAPDQAYQNGGNNPCLFDGGGGGGCNQGPANFPTPTPDTQVFSPNPLTKTFVGADLLAFAVDVGGQFFLGLDINDTSSAQTLSNVTVNFFNSASVNIGSYVFAPATPIPSNANGNGYADFILAAGCSGTVGGGSGILATCTNYAPFIAPIGTRRIDFSFGLTGFNDGADKLFAITSGPTVTPFCTVDPCNDDVVPVPEPTSLILLGGGLAGIAAKVRRSRAKARA